MHFNTHPYRVVVLHKNVRLSVRATTFLSIPVFVDHRITVTITSLTKTPTQMKQNGCIHAFTICICFLVHLLQV